MVTENKEKSLTKRMLHIILHLGNVWCQQDYLYHEMTALGIGLSAIFVWESCLLFCT